MRLFAAVRIVAFWHFSAVPAAPINVRSWGENGLNADTPERPNLTHFGHPVAAVSAAAASIQNNSGPTKDTLALLWQAELAANR